MKSRMTIAVLRAAALAGALALSTTALAEDMLKPFATDGCSVFPDRSLVTNEDWCDCCVAHDFAYWRGGTREERLKADRALKACIIKTTGNLPLAQLVYTGVRSGGAPNKYTSYRWAYGWPPGRGYRPLTAKEAAAADALLQQYRASVAGPMCPTAAQ